MKLSWSREAERNLEDIFDYIAQDDPKAAMRWVQRLQGRAEAASDLPMAGRVVPEIGRSDVQEVFCRTYRIVYRVTESAVVVLTVFEGHRVFPGDDLDDSQG